MEERFLTRAEAAEALRCSTATITRYMKVGKVPRVKVGRRALIPAAFIESLKKEAMK